MTVTYSDGETSGHRVFTDRDKAETWAERQLKSSAVKKVAVEPFTDLPGKAERLTTLTYQNRTREMMARQVCSVGGL